LFHAAHGAEAVGDFARQLVDMEVHVLEEGQVAHVFKKILNGFNVHLVIMLVSFYIMLFGPMKKHPVPKRNLTLEKR
jgi:hypothetical protein